MPKSNKSVGVERIEDTQVFELTKIISNLVKYLKQCMHYEKIMEIFKKKYQEQIK